MAASAYDVVLHAFVKIHKMGGKAADSDDQMQIITGIFLRLLQGFGIYGGIALEHLAAQGQKGF